MRGSTRCFPLWAWPPRGSTRTTALPPNEVTTWSSTPLWAHVSSICAWPSSPSSAPRSRTSRADRPVARELRCRLAAPSPATSRASPTSKSMITTTSCSPASRRPLAPYSARPLPELSLAWRCALSARSTTPRASTVWSPRLPATLHHSPWVPSTKRMSSPAFPP